MAHIAKYQSGAIGHMCALYENEAMQANGYNLGPKRLISQVQFISERISALALKRHVRKDAVSLCDCIVTLPRSFDDNREREFFKTAYTFLSQRYGVDNVVSAYIHRNSSRPHMHFAWIPVTEDGRLLNLRADRSKLSEGEPNTNLYFKFPRTDADLIEEAADIKAYNEALMEDDATRYSMDDVMHMAMEAE